MKKIPKTMTKYGREYRLVHRASDKALYEIISKDGSKDYEVHKVRFKAARTSKIGTRVVTTVDREVLASSEEFGSMAWAYSNYDIAKEKYDTLK